MAVTIDAPPVYDVVTIPSRDGDVLSPSWQSWFSAFVQTLSEYLTQEGIKVPRLTTVQRNAIQAPINGQMIYNTTDNKFQGYQSGTWQNFI